MKQHQTAHEPAEELRAPRLKNIHQENQSERKTEPEAEGGSWQFRALIVIIAFGVLMIIGKAFGLF